MFVREPDFWNSEPFFLHQLLAELLDLRLHEERAVLVGSEVVDKAEESVIIFEQFGCIQVAHRVAVPYAFPEPCQRSLVVLLAVNAFCVSDAKVVLGSHKSFLRSMLQVKKRQGRVPLSDNAFAVNPTELEVAECIVLSGAPDVVVKRNVRVMLNVSPLVVDHSQVEVGIVDSLVSCIHKVLIRGLKALFLS